MNQAITNLKKVLGSRQAYHAALFVAAAFIVLFFMPADAMAQSLPWDQGTCRAAKAITGSWLGWIAVIAIVIASVAFAMGELNGPMKNAMTIIAGVSMATSAVSLVGWFWPSVGAMMAGAAC